MKYIIEGPFSSLTFDKEISSSEIRVILFAISSYICYSKKELFLFFFRLRIDFVFRLRYLSKDSNTLCGYPH